MTESLADRLVRHEGLKLNLYHDSLGFATIGVGRCLAKRGISKDEAIYMLNNDIRDVQQQAAAAMPWILGIDEGRQDIIYEMIFQLGIKGVLAFPKMIAAIRIADWASAANEMLNSAWHTQTPERCEELANLMLNGENN